MEHGKQLESAFASRLIAINPSPWQEDLTDADNGLRIYGGENELEKNGTRIVCYISGDLNEDPPFSGNRWCDLLIELKTPVVDDGGASLALHESNATALQNAIMDDGLVSGVNTSTLLVYGITEKTQFRGQDESAWTSGFKLRVYSAMQ